MKKLLIILLLFPAISIYSQNKKEKPDKYAIVPDMPYDSTANFLGDKVAQYTGQELYLKELSKSERQLGYAGFILEYKKDGTMTYDEKNIYKCCQSYNSKYDELAGRYFDVLEVIKPPKNKKVDNANYNDEYYLKIKEKESGDILYFKYDIKSEFTFPFLVTGYLQKQKALITGKKYVFAEDVFIDSKNLETGKQATNILGQEWTCTDLFFDKESASLSIVIEDKKQKAAIPFSLIDPNLAIRKAYTAQEAASYYKRFNKFNFNRILRSKVAKNMTTEMCRMSWGEPIEIKESGSKNNKKTEWIYPASTLVFKNNKLVIM